MNEPPLGGKRRTRRRLELVVLTPSLGLAEDPGEQGVKLIFEKARQGKLSKFDITTRDNYGDIKHWRVYVSPRYVYPSVRRKQIVIFDAIHVTPINQDGQEIGEQQPAYLVLDTGVIDESVPAGTLYI